MDGQPPMVFVQGPVAQNIEHLGIHHSGDEIEGRVAVGYHRKQGDFFIPQLIQLHFVILHHVPDSLNVKGGQPCTAGDQDAFQGLARRHFEFDILPDGKMVGRLLLQSFKQQIDGRLEVFIILPALAGVEHIQQHTHVFLFGRGLVVDIGDQRLIQKGLRLAPKIFAALVVLALGVFHDDRHQRKNVRFAVQIAEGVIVHGSAEINGVQDLQLISTLLHQHPTHFFDHGALRV